MWEQFIGNGEAVGMLRGLVAAGQGCRTLVLAGPEGVGKTTLAYLFGLALNCEAPGTGGAICGQCASCRQAAAPAALAERLAEAVSFRAAEVKTSPRETAPLVVAPHPAVRWYPPDGDMLSLPQARALMRQAHLTPDAGRRWVLIVADLDRARWATQAALLKTLEEPPPAVAIVALARNPLALLPTVRSRALLVRLAPVAAPELARVLAARGAAAPELVARLAHGRPGRALGFDLEAYRARRAQALELVRAAAADRPAAAALLSASESTRGSKEIFESLVEILYSVLQDIGYLQSGFSEAVCNVDCLPELDSLARRFQPSRLAALAEGLDRAQSAAERNAFRPLALAAWALQRP
ncbi:MAG: DNA polymerase III subunit delta' C-terminal domain-containing protein [Terriglobales bacterium]